MDKKKEIVHVDAELIPKSDSGMKDSDEKAISRRRMLEAGAAALALLMMPKLAFAYTCGGFTFSWPPSGPNLYGDGREAHFEGCANGSVIHNDPEAARCQAGTRVRRGQFVYPGKLPFGWLSHGTGDARAQPR